MTWRDHLGAGLELGAEIASGLEPAELPAGDRRRLDEAKDMLGDAVEQLAAAEGAEARRRALATVAVLRETIRQTAHLDAVVTAQALKATARQVAEGALQIALDAVGAAMLEGNA